MKVVRAYSRWPSIYDMGADVLCDDGKVRSVLFMYIADFTEAEYLRFIARQLVVVMKEEKKIHHGVWWHRKNKKRIMAGLVGKEFQFSAWEKEQLDD